MIIKIPKRRAFVFFVLIALFCVTGCDFFPPGQTNAERIATVEECHSACLYAVHNNGGTALLCSPSDYYDADKTFDPKKCRENKEAKK